MEKKRKIIILTIIGGISLIIIVSLSIFLGIYFSRRPYLIHDTNRWAVLKDSSGDIIAVETTDDKIWNELVNLEKNGSKMFIGSIVERYDNKWGFRYKPSNLTIAEATIEGAQATLKYISENLNYWLGQWAYTKSIVTATYN